MSGNNETYYLCGRPVEYWLELQRRVDAEAGFDTSRLVSEIADLRGRLSFFESRAKEMASMIREIK